MMKGSLQQILDPTFSQNILEIVKLIILKMGKIPVDTNHHQSTLLQRLNEMRDTKDYCNFTIKVGSTEIFAHRNILSAGSDYFAAMLSHDTKEKQTGVVDIKVADPACIKKCIDFIYTGISPDVEDDIERLMYSAHLLQLTTLCDGIIELLDEELSLQSFFLTRRLANMYDSKQLDSKCDSFLLKKFEAISKMDEFGHVDKTFVEKMLSSRDMNISEACKLDALLRWVKFRAGERKKFLEKMLKFITLSKISPGYLRHFIENETLIKNDSKMLLRFSVTALDNLSVKPQTLETSETADAIAVFDKGSGYIRLFNPTENSLSQLQGMNDDMKQDKFTAICVGDYIYVFMKNKSIYRLDYLDITTSWEYVGATIDDHGNYPPVIGFQDCIYIIGRYGVETDTVEKFNTLTSECVKLPDKLHSTNAPAIVELNNKIYCCGGYFNGSYTNIVDCFDPKFLTWVPITPMNEAKCDLTAVASNNKVFVLGGWNGKNALQTVESYDPLNCEWSILKKMNTARALFRCFAINEFLYAVGGYWSSKTIERHDISKDDWTDVTISANISEYLNIVESVKIRLIT